MGQQTTSSERIDELPVLIYWLKQMRVDVIIDKVLGAAHGNWDGLSYGEVALVFIAHVVMRCTHFLSPVEAWAAQHLTSLSQALGKPVRAQDCTDDRLAVVLSKLGQVGEEEPGPGEAIEAELGQHLLRAYALPTETARIDLTTVAVHHQPPDEEGLMRFGYSKDHRPDLRQFKVLLGTLDPVGLPLATATLSGEQADDPQYVPAWERLVATIGRPDFLLVGDCKLASLENRARIHQGGGYYLTPLPLTGQTPAELQAWVLQPPEPPHPIRLPRQAAHEPPVGQGFAVAVPCWWQDSDTQLEVTWTERRVVVQSAAHARTQRASLQARLAKAQAALRALNTKPARAQASLATRAQAILTQYRVTDYLGVRVRERVSCRTAYEGRGRPGPHKPCGHARDPHLERYRPPSSRRHCFGRALGRVARLCHQHPRRAPECGGRGQLLSPTMAAGAWLSALERGLAGYYAPLFTRRGPHSRPARAPGHCPARVDPDRVCGPARLGGHRRYAPRALCWESQAYHRPAHSRTLVLCLYPYHPVPPPHGYGDLV